MNDITKRLVEESLHSEERLATSDEILNIQGNITQQILGDVAFFPVEDKKTPEHTVDKDIKKYLIPLSQRDIRKYNPQLETDWEHMKTYNNQENDIGTIKEIEHILTQYHESLSLHDEITLYLLLAHRRLEKNTQTNQSAIDGTLQLLNHLASYEPKMNTHQKDDFRYYLGVANFCKAKFSGNTALYTPAIKAFDAVLFAEYRDTYRKEVTENMLPDERYKELLYYKIHALHKLGEHEKIIKPTEYYLEACGWNPKTGTHTDPQDKKHISQTLLIQGKAYEGLQRPVDARISYEGYLLLNPHDKAIQAKIDSLKPKQ